MAGSKTLDIIMPQMGESITEATITGWRKKVGEQVSEGEPLLDISTAKVEVEIPSPGTGYLTAILFESGSTVPIDTVIARLGAKDEVGAAAAPAPPAKEPVKTASTAPVTPAKVTAPATPEPAPVHRGNGKANGTIESADDIEREREHLIRRRSTPVVRQMADQLRIDLSKVIGSGIHGRVTKKDLEDYITRTSEITTSEELIPRESPHPTSLPAGTVRLENAPPADRVAMAPEEHPTSLMRRMIADQLLKSKTTIPHAYTVHEVDFTRLDKVRVRNKPIFEKQYEARLTPLVFLVKAVTETLLNFPHVNASYRGDKIVVHKTVNIGIAVAVPDGLVVPVLKGVEALSLAGIARGLVDLANRARANRLKPSDMEGGTFTITSPGQLGAVMAIPIINPPQGAILHFGAIQKVPAVVTGPDGDDVIAVRQRAMLTLGIDHRLLDGWEADKFMAALKELLQKADFGLV